MNATTTTPADLASAIVTASEELARVAIAKSVNVRFYTREGVAVVGTFSRTACGVNLDAVRLA